MIYKNTELILYVFFSQPHTVQHCRGKRYTENKLMPMLKLSTTTNFENSKEIVFSTLAAVLQRLTSAKTVGSRLLSKRKQFEPYLKSKKAKQNCVQFLFHELQGNNEEWHRRKWGCECNQSPCFFFVFRGVAI